MDRRQEEEEALRSLDELADTEDDPYVLAAQALDPNYDDDYDDDDSEYENQRDLISVSATLFLEMSNGSTSQSF